MNTGVKLLKALCFTACALFLMTDPATAAHCDKKPNHPHCNGDGGGGNEHAVDMTFRNTGILSDPGADRFRGDSPVSGTVTYTDAEPGVSLRIRSDGILLFNITSTDRAVVFDFSDPELSLPPQCGANCTKDFDVASTDNFPPAAAGTIQVFDDIDPSRHRTDQFLGMNIGETLLGEMKVGFGEPRKSTRFSVRFQALGEGAIDENIAAKSNFLEVTRISQTTWSIESLDSISTGGDQALLFSN